MPIDMEEVLNAASMVADQEHMRATVRHSAKGALICGTACFIGGLLAGPVGLAVGGTVGGITAYRATSSSNFRPVADIIRNDLTAVQRERLYERIVNAVRQVQPQDLIALAPLLLTSMTVKQAVIHTISSFVANELQMQLGS